MALVRFELETVDENIAKDDVADSVIDAAVHAAEDELRNRVGSLLYDNEVDCVFEPMDASSVVKLLTGKINTRVFAHVPYDSTEFVETIFEGTDITARPIFETPEERAEARLSYSP